MVFKSRDTKSNDIYKKAHKVSDIAVHTGLNAEGNVLINPRFNGEFLDINVLPAFVSHFITSLTFTKNQTSTTLGIKEGDQDFKGTFQTLKELIATYSEYWEK